MSRIKIVIASLLIFVLCGCSQAPPTSHRAPTEQEIASFMDSMGAKTREYKRYSDYAIVLGDHSIFSLSILSNGEPQFIGSSWEKGNEAQDIQVTGVLEQSSYVGVIIDQKEVLSQGTKLEVVFEDSSTAEEPMNGKNAYIIDHPRETVTNISKAKVSIYDDKNEVIYQSSK